jgi:hypothetical protein
MMTKQTKKAKKTRRMRVNLKRRTLDALADLVVLRRMTTVMRWMSMRKKRNQMPSTVVAAAAAALEHASVRVSSVLHDRIEISLIIF